MQAAEFENRVILNIGGTRFETYKTILKKIPATRLSRLTEALVNYDPVTNEYFFDRHPGVFSQILNYYRTGKLHYPTNVCGPLFEEELNFWGLDSNQVEPCCWKTFTKHRDTELTLTTLDRLNIDVDRTSKQDLIIKFGLNDILPNDRFASLKQAQPILWQLFEEPRSSNSSFVIACIQIFMICLSVGILWLKSYASSIHTTFSVQSVDTGFIKQNETSSSSLSFRILDERAIFLVDILDYLTHTWFCFDLTLRFLVSPDRVAFLKNMNNYVDIIMTAWFFINALISNYYYNHLLNSLEVLRVLRLLRLLNYHPGLRIIITSLKISAAVLQLLVIVMVVSAVIFGSLIYYAEKLTTSDPDNNLFISIPEALWYSVVSLTTIGFGDLAPVTAVGRAIGVLTVITGVLMIGLPMTIVVEIFSNFYNHLRARSKLPKQRRRVLPVEAPRQRKKHHDGPVREKPNIRIQEAL